jgi:hypothetical protein
MKLPNLIKPVLSFLVILYISVPMAKAQVPGSKEVAVKDFSEIHITTGIELIIRQGSTESAKIVADEALIDAVVVEQAGNSLNIKWELVKSTRKKWLNRTAKIYITYKNLNVIEASDGSSLKTENTINTSILDISVSSGAIVTATIACPELHLKSSSGASALLKGTVGNMRLEASSGSIVNALDLTADYAKVAASSAADLKINVRKELETTSNSGSKIRYMGNPALQNYSGSKGGIVKRIE